MLERIAQEMGMAIVQHQIVNGVSRSILDALNMAKTGGTTIAKGGQDDPFNADMVQLRDQDYWLLVNLVGRYVDRDDALGRLEGLCDTVQFGEGSPDGQVFSIIISTTPAAYNLSAAAYT